MLGIGIGITGVIETTLIPESRMDTKAEPVGGAGPIVRCEVAVTAGRGVLFQRSGSGDDRGYPIIH